MHRTCYRSGADEFLDKPFEIEQLLATMRRMTSAGELQVV
jgi:DNA-binding response OmpR family regulator